MATADSKPQAAAPAPAGPPGGTQPAVNEPAKTWRQRLQALPKIVALIRPYAGLLLLCLMLTLLRSALDLLQPFLMKAVIDVLGPLGGQAAPSDDIAALIARFELTPWGLLVWIAAIGLCALIVSAACSYVISLAIGRVTYRLITDYRNRLQYHLTRTALQKMEDLKIGGMTSRIMTDPQNLSVLAGQGLVNSIGALFTLLVATAILFWLDVPMALISALSLPVLILAARGWIAKLRPMAREFRQANQVVTANLTESLGGSRVVKAYHREQAESEKFAAGSEGLFARSLQILRVEINLSAVLGSLIGVVSLLMVLFGGVQILNQAMTPGDLVQFYGTLLMMLFPLGQLLNFIGSLQGGLAGLDRIEEVLSIAPEEPPDAVRQPWPANLQALQFERLQFRYGPDKPLVLDDIGFTAPVGSVTALVGPSGSGKSTLVHLIARFLQPTAGAIRATTRQGAIDIAEIRLADWRGHLGMVLQENYLFDGSVRDNIAYARPTATDAEVQEVARQAHCLEFIADFAEGLQTIVGERGVRLSGGQKQRIAIARALLAQPALLILDEATSSLDSESEAAIQAGMQTLIRNRTTFVIAHRLSTIRNADQILVLEKGRLIERGSHAELMALGGRYQAMYTAQYGIENNRLRLPGDDAVSATPAQPEPTDEKAPSPLTKLPFLDSTG